jgi:hypothetical protein
MDVITAGSFVVAQYEGGKLFEKHDPAVRRQYDR